MMIGGLQPCSFIDFPGELALVVFTRGCDLRCGYCHNPALVLPRGPAPVSIEQVFALLEARRGRLTGVVVTGGEPTLHGDLGDFVARVKRLGFRVKVDTNGVRPDAVRRLLDRGDVDYVAMDLKDEPGEYAETTGTSVDPAAIRASIACILASGIDHEFRTTVVHPRHDLDRLQRMAVALTGARRWFLQRFRPGRLLGDSFAGQAPSRAFLADVAARITASGLACGWR